MGARRHGRIYDRRPDRCGTYDYAPVTGQRDILGYIRAPQAGSTGTGYGSNPFMDIGAYQYVNLNPPEVTGVTETPTQGATPVNFYSVGGISGVNQTPWTINITFNGPISPSSIMPTGSVSLVDLGSNPSQPLDQDINLSGKLSYNASTDTLVINLAAAGADAGDRRLPDHPVRQRLAGHHELTRRGARWRKHGRRQPVRITNWPFPRATAIRAATSTTRSSSTRRLRSRGRLAHARPGQRYQYRRRRHHDVDSARHSTARSASPTPPWCPLPARPSSSTLESKSTA